MLNRATNNGFPSDGGAYRADISTAYGKPDDHHGLVIKYPFQSAEHFHLILQQIKLQYKNNATHPVVLLNTKEKTLKRGPRSSLERF